MAVRENLPQVIGNNISTTTVSSMTDSALSFQVNDPAGMNTAGGMIVLDYGVEDKEEVVYAEAVTSNTITIANDGRGLCGTVAVSHDAGATVRDILVDEHIERIRSTFLVEHNESGAHVLIDEALALSGTTISPSNKILDQDGANSASTIDFDANNRVVDMAYLQDVPGQLINGKIQVTVAANDITLAVKTLDGNDPSTSDPVNVRIGNAVRQITAPLSVTVLDGTSTFNAGSVELGGKEIDYFSYVGWRDASSAVVLGFARIPYAGLYSDFSGTATNQRYAAFSTTPASTDEVEVCGRFAATLSLAGTSHLWTVPAFTNKNLISRPIYETRLLNYQPVYGAGGSMTYTSVTTTFAQYIIIGRTCRIEIRNTGTLGGSASTTVTATLPMGINVADYNASVSVYESTFVGDSAGFQVGMNQVTVGAPTLVQAIKNTLSNWATGGFDWRGGNTYLI